MIRTCTCKHAFQDAEHGAFQRVFTPGLKAWRCTVCGSSVTRSDGEAKKAAK